MADSAPRRRFRFGTFELQPADRRLLCDGAPVAIGPRALDLLTVLVERAGHLVTKDELLERVWPRVVVEDNSVQAQVSAVRKILGGDAIRTASGRGYCFERDVTVVDESAHAPPRTAQNLPYPQSSFVGREKELSQVRDLLASVPMVCLTGSGGCGKTRLAVEIAHRLQGGYDDGVCFVELAPISEPSLVPNALLAALGIKEQRGGDTTQLIAESLASKRLLLVLDNAEHLLEATATLAKAVLEGCRGVSLLVTSRERLAVGGEATYRVPSLSLPDAGHDIAPPHALEFEAIRLFVERVRLHRPHFSLAEENAKAVVSICRRLDGIPLALELAAPRLRSMSAQEIDQRLDHRFALLTSASRIGSQRQRTLRAMVDWSYDLLSGEERQLLRRLAVFAGGWTLEAAERVCTDAATDAALTLRHLASLCDKSLLSVDEDRGVVRYRMLQTVRDYATERLAEEDDTEFFHGRMLDYFLGLSEGAAGELAGEDPGILERFATEQDNLRAALDWSAGTATRASSSVRLALALERFWWRRGEWAEGLAALRRALDASKGSVESPMRAKGLYHAAIFAQLRGDYASSRLLHAESLALRRRLGDFHAIAASLLAMGVMDREQGLNDSALGRYHEALAHARQLGDTNLIARCLNNLGNLLGQVNDLVAARACLEESLAIRRAIGDLRGIASSLHNLATIAELAGDAASARSLCDESVALHRRMGEPRGIANSVSALASIKFQLGDQPTAEALLQESLAILSQIGDAFGTLNAMDGLADVVASVNPLRAATLWGASERMRQSSGMPARGASRPDADAHLQAARRTAGEEAFSRAWHAGRALERADALAYALSSAHGAKDQASRPDS